MGVAGHEVDSRPNIRHRDPFRHLFIEDGWKLSHHWYMGRLPYGPLGGRDEAVWCLAKHIGDGLYRER